MSLNENQIPTSAQFYDYLEGTMPAPERAEFQRQLATHAAWETELKKHKDFLTLLHSLTGKLSLTAEEVQGRIDAVASSVQDYEQVVDETYCAGGVTQTMTSRVWYKRPDFYRLETSNPATGPLAVFVVGNEALNWMKDLKQAVKIAVTESFKRQLDLHFPESLRKLAADKTNRLLETEYLHGRPALHIQFSENVDGGGEMNTHLWMDKDTWMPLVTEEYNTAGELVRRRVVREVRLNQGLKESFFVPELPADVTVKDETAQPVKPMREITLAEAPALLGFTPYVPVGTDYQAKHFWQPLREDSGALLSHYAKPGEPLPALTVTQGKIPHANIPPHLPQEPIKLQFGDTEVEGSYIQFEIGMIRHMIVLYHQEVYLCAGASTKEDLVREIARLKAANA